MRAPFALTPVVLLGFAARAADVEPLAARPITLPRGVVELTVHGTYTNWSAGSIGGASSSSLSGGTFALGADFGATDRVQIGLATALPIAPGAGFGSILASLAAAADSDSAVRLDVGFENFGANGIPRGGHTKRFFGGLGARIRKTIAPGIAFVTGRTGAAQFGKFSNVGESGVGLYVGATFLTEDTADLLVVSGGDNGSDTIIGINLPVGLLVQPDPHFAVTLQSGYSAAIAAPNSGPTVTLHFVPLGLEAVLSPAAALDVGARLFVDGYVARSGGTGTSNFGYFDLRAVMLWIRVRT